jgi:hypothetical protein
MAQALESPGLESLPAMMGLSIGSKLQGRLPPTRDSFVNALLCFCSVLAPSEGGLDIYTDVVAETTS